MYGAKHGGFTSLRELPGLLGGGGGGRTLPAASVSSGVASGNGQLPSLGGGGFASLTVSGGAPSADFGPIGGPAPKASGRPSMLSAGPAAPATYGGRPRTPPPLPPLQTRRSNRCAIATAGTRLSMRRTDGCLAYPVWIFGQCT